MIFKRNIAVDFNDPGMHAYAGALHLVEEKFELLREAYGEETLSMDARLAKKLLDEANSALLQLDHTLYELRVVSGRLSESDEFKNAQVIRILSSWLDNIQMMKKGDLIDR